MNDVPERPIDPTAVAAAEANMLPPRDERRMRELLDALCDPTRVKIVQALSGDNTLAAGDLAHVIGRSRSATSQHLKVLRDIGVVSASRDGNVVRYNPQSGGMTYHATGLGSLYETRVVYDPTTDLLYLGAFGGPALYSFNVATGTTTTLAPIPESQLNDIFCGDRAGHIYAAGDSSGTTIWQYDIATDSWAAIPAFPIDHGNNGSCTVSDTGYLYVSSGSTDLYRLPLF